MKQKDKNSLVFGLLLIIIGGLFITYQFVPGLKDALQGMFTWPMIIIAFGLYLLIKNLVDKDHQGLVSACVISGVGGILYLQEMTSGWADWYYWLLIPGFAGVGHLLGALLGERGSRTLERGLWLIGLSAVLFAVFSPVLQLNFLVGQYWPVILIAAGVVLIFKAVRSK